MLQINGTASNINQQGTDLTGDSMFIDPSEDDAACNIAVDDNTTYNTDMEVVNTSEDTAFAYTPINQGANEVLVNIDHDIAVAVLKAFQLIEEMGGSQKKLLDIITYGKELYCKGDIQLLNR